MDYFEFNEQRTSTRACAYDVIEIEDDVWVTETEADDETQRKFRELVARTTLSNSSEQAGHTSFAPAAGVR